MHTCMSIRPHMSSEHTPLWSLQIAVKLTRKPFFISVGTFTAVSAFILLACIHVKDNTVVRHIQHVSGQRSTLGLPVEDTPHVFLV